jgi:hypothetical protein
MYSLVNRCAQYAGGRARSCADQRINWSGMATTIFSNAMGQAALQPLRIRHAGNSPTTGPQTTAQIDSPQRYLLTSSL